jgi:hypothetical protein
MSNNCIFFAIIYTASSRSLFDTSALSITLLGYKLTRCPVWIDFSTASTAFSAYSASAVAM